MAISMLKIRRPLGRLIFNMGIAIPGKTVFLIETASWGPFDDFLPAIQMRYKFRPAVIPLQAIRSQQFFAHATIT